MAKLNAIIVELLSTTIKTVGESKLVEVLQKLHDKNPDNFSDKIKAIHLGLLWMQPEVQASKTKIDDAVLEGLLEALEASALANGVEL